MRNFIFQTFLPALGAVMIDGQSKRAEQPTSAPDKTASQAIVLDPVIVGEQPHGAYVPHIPGRQRRE